MVEQLGDTPGVIVNDRPYRLPERPTVVITVDGGDPRYFDDALSRGLMPRLAEMLASGGQYAVGLGEMPSFTNPNNMSIVSGVSPATHGIPGNHYADSAGNERQLDDPAFLRATTILAELYRRGLKVLSITAKDKLRRMLAHDGAPAVSAERAHELNLEAYGISDLCALVGRKNPGIYDWELSQFALELGLAVHRHIGGLALLYVSTTDFVQHKCAPRTELADRFLRAFDELLGAYLDEGFAVGVTADHGMNDKQNPGGSPRVLYLEDVLNARGIRNFQVVLPITDPYVRHHGALGSFAWVNVPEDQLVTARDALRALDGVDEVYTREESGAAYEHPLDRIGDLSVASDASTALGKSLAKHDLSQVVEGLRSHGGRHEQWVPIIVSHPLSEPYAERLRHGMRNRDIHDLVLNGPHPIGA
jgi:phosphonoacetate hydrolase